MAIHILVDSDVLSRSRFALSPAFEVVASLRARGRHPAVPPGCVHHLRRWEDRARARVDGRTLDLLHALVPTSHPYTPDFLTPRPTGTRDTIRDCVEAIAGAPEDVVAYHLDIGIDGRAVRPEVVAQFASEEAYRRWRRPAPPTLAPLLRAGPRAVAQEAARAVEAYFAAAVAEDWPDVRAVLESDVALRAEQISARGWAAVLEDLGDLTWTGTEVTVERPFEGVVDWADDGVLLVPSAGHAGPVQFCAEPPDSPVLVYAARGTAALWSGARPRPGGQQDVAGLIGPGRGAILAVLDRPRTTRDLSRIDGRSESTISYHLGVLARAGLVAKRRSGRGVAYRRTVLADTLLAAGRGAVDVEGA